MHIEPKDGGPLAPSTSKNAPRCWPPPDDEANEDESNDNFTLEELGAAGRKDNKELSAAGAAQAPPTGQQLACLPITSTQVVYGGPDLAYVLHQARPRP